MDKQKYIKWYNLAKDFINDISLIGDRTDEEIISDCVSEEDWLIFLPYGVTKEQAKSSENPNIYFYIRKINVIGLTFNNVKAVDKIKNILSPYSIIQKELIVNKILTLDNNWKTILNRKITKKHHNNVPEYTLELEIQTNTINDYEINKLFTLSSQIRKEGRDKSKEIRIKNDLFYREVPSIDLMKININLTDEEFNKRIIEAFDIMKICLAVKLDSEIKKIQKEEHKSIKIKKCPNCGEPYKLDTSKTICKKINCDVTKLQKSKMPKSEYERLVSEGKIND